MIGKEQIVIDGADFVRGASTSNDLTDGGFSPTTQAVNLTYSPGVLNGVPAMVDKSTNLTGEGIAYTPSDVTGINGFILSSNGKILSIDSTQTLTSSSALTGTFTVGTSDIINFYASGGADKIYATSTTDICRMDTDLTNGNSTWWTVTLGKSALTSSCRHPMLNYIGYVFVADGHRIHRIESDTAGTANVLLLNVQNQITAIGIDISTGQMLIATTHGVNYSGTVATGNRVFVWDGQSTVPSREIVVDSMITAFRNVGGITFCSMPQSVGYWNGNGVTFLRKLVNVTLTGADLPYKNHLTNIGNTLCVIDGNSVLAYGEVVAGRRVFYPMLYNTVGSNSNFSLICTAGDNKIGVCFPTSKFYTFDTVGTGSGTLNTFKTNRLSFPRPVFIRSVHVEYAGSGVSSGDTGRTLYFSTSAAATTLTAMSSMDNTTGATVWETRGIIGVSERVNWVQFFLATSSTAGIRRIIIYYDVAE